MPPAMPTTVSSINPINPAEVPADPLERNVWVLGQLKLRGLSLAGIAARQGVNRRNLSAALRLPSINAETAICDALGTRPDILFHERYDRAGRRLHPVRKHSACPPSGNVKGIQAA